MVEMTKKDAPARKRPSCWRDRGEVREESAAGASEDGRGAGGCVAGGPEASAAPRCRRAMAKEKTSEG
jgi:hypothetical protein